MVLINIGNMGSKEKAERIKQVLSGKSFYNFQVSTVSFMGNWPVSVWTDHEGADEREVLDMVIFILAGSL